MINKEMCAGPVSLENERRLRYKMLSVGFTYPDQNFFDFFPEFLSKKEKIIAEYDRLFRAGKVWLYASEHMAENEFQRVNMLSDIMAFYNAFGVEPNNDRPDSVSGELEFMYYLISKKLYADESQNDLNAPEKAKICLDAQKKFFGDHLYPAVKKISEIIISKTGNSFYQKISKDTLCFLEEERKSFRIRA